jgi:hypothetical protein
MFATAHYMGMPATVEKSFEEKIQDMADEKVKEIMEQ